MAEMQTGTDESRRHLMSRVQRLSLVLRQGANLIVAVATVADPASIATPEGKWLLGALGCWSVYRLLTRSASRSMLIIDYCLTLVICLALPIIAPASDFYLGYGAPQVVAAMAVIGFCGELRASTSIPMTVIVAVAYAIGSAGVVGWSRVLVVDDSYYLLLQGSATAIVRFLLVRAATAAHRMRSLSEASELDRQIVIARKNFDQEQLALLGSCDVTVGF